MKKKAIYENIIKSDFRSFHFREDRINYAAETGMHVHPEYELAYLSKGGGIRCVNDVVDEFYGDDIVLVPGGVPHCWVFDPAQCSADGIICDCCCQFSFETIEKLSHVMPELRLMAEFYRDLQQALRLTGVNYMNAIDFFDTVNQKSESCQSLDFLRLLNEIYETGEYQFIGSPDIIDVKGLQPRMKFNAIQKLITENYYRTIPLAEAAELVGMNKTAFCTAFRRMYGISFVKYLTHYRLKTAARLMLNTTQSISEIAYSVGFNDIPHFNRQFSNYFKTSPSKYRRNIGTH